MAPTNSLSLLVRSGGIGAKRVSNHAKPHSFATMRLTRWGLRAERQEAAA